MARPAENVVGFYNKRGTCEQWIREGKGDPMDTAFVSLVRREGLPSSASCARLQSRQLPAHIGDAGADQGLVADELEGKTDQDRR